MKKKCQTNYSIKVGKCNTTHDEFNDKLVKILEIFYLMFINLETYKTIEYLRKKLVKMAINKTGLTYSCPGRVVIPPATKEVTI